MFAAHRLGRGGLRVPRAERRGQDHRPHARRAARADLRFPLLAAWAIWTGLAISTRATDNRVAYQLSVLSSLPPVAVTALMSFNLITPAFGTAAFAGDPVVIDCAACPGVPRLFDREQLITGTRS